MDIVNVKISELKPSGYNPRQMTEKQAKALEASIKEFGLVDPIIVNKHGGRENVVVGGHQRLKILKNLGVEEIPVFYVDLELEKEKRLNIRLNKNSGEWDFEMLANMDMEMQELVGLGFDEKQLKKSFNLEQDPGEPTVEPIKEEAPKKGKGKKRQNLALKVKVLKAIDKLIAEEIVIAQKEGEKTSRLTSLRMKIVNLDILK